MSDSEFYNSIIFIVFFLFSILFSFLINGLFLKFSKTLGIRQTQTENLIRWASTAKPSVGGFSFYILFLISATVYAIFNLYIEDDFNLKLVGLILSCSVGFLIGLADDAYNTVPFLKFAGQLVCSIIKYHIIIINLPRCATRCLDLGNIAVLNNQFPF